MWITWQNMAKTAEKVGFLTAKNVENLFNMLKSHGFYEIVFSVTVSKCHLFFCALRIAQPSAILYNLIINYIGGDSHDQI